MMLSSKVAVPRTVAAPRSVNRFAAPRTLKVATRAYDDATVISLVEADHNKVRDIYKQYQSATDPKEKENLVFQAIKWLSVHAAKEEEVLYPVISQKKGDDVAAHLRGDHQKLKELLVEVDGTTIDDPKFIKNFEAAIQEFEKHAKEEEGQTLPELKTWDLDLVDLGRKFEAAGEFTITRPHPLAPDAPPANLVGNKATAPLDYVRDQARFGGNPPQ